MQGGFSFCGVDIETLGLHYAPSLADTYIFKDSQYSLLEESFNSHDGGYFYGTSSQPKTFTLRCYFEDSNINNGILTRIGGLFSRGRTGKLEFQHREWIWYNATVVNVDYSALTNYMNGFITISMKAYYPFGRFNYVSIPDSFGSFVLGRAKLNIDKLASMNISETSANNLAGLMNNSGLLFSSITPPTQIASPSNMMVSKEKILLYNGGTERASVAIEIAGDVKDGVSIVNHTTGQTCKIVALTKNVTGNMNRYLVCDGLNGKTVMVNNSGTMKELSFIYHDSGFIDLAPSNNVKRDVAIYAYNGTKNIKSDAFVEDDIGKHVHVNGTWYKIESLTGNMAIVDNTIQATTGSYTSDIVTMNEIEIVPSSTMELTRLNFVYKPTFK